MYIGKENSILQRALMTYAYHEFWTYKYSANILLIHEMRCQPEHNTWPQARLSPNFLGMDDLTTERSSDSQDMWSLMCSDYFYYISFIGDCTTSHWQTSGRLVQELNACTAIITCSARQDGITHSAWRRQWPRLYVTLQLPSYWRQAAPCLWSEKYGIDLPSQPEPLQLNHSRTIRKMES